MSWQSNQYHLEYRTSGQDKDGIRFRSTLSLETGSASQHCKQPTGNMNAGPHTWKRRTEKVARPWRDVLSPRSCRTWTLQTNHQSVDLVGTHSH